ncbi:Uncharacterized protein APZ42_021030 [Daphnia magna]|uniref:Uncharacterized protein n=1 Tax=Daphnia magna TaxID=35525 RepID=A0A0P5YF71_9CRUS|nr:Uncharacterized protein APZ42_021030 [Daphnia magna]
MDIILGPKFAYTPLPFVFNVRRSSDSADRSFPPFAIMIFLDGKFDDCQRFQCTCEEQTRPEVVRIVLPLSPTARFSRRFKPHWFPVAENLRR